MPCRVLIVPDKLKGTLSAQAAAQAIARGWIRARPNDQIELLPMSDGGEGFGEVLSALIGAKPRSIRTINAAHKPVQATWWFASQTAVIESSRIIGLAMLPKKFHPFQLDTFGLGAVIRAAAKAGTQRCYIGVGGSATNDGGFGLARALGWKFFDQTGNPIQEWWQLHALVRVEKPLVPLPMDITVAADVRNILLGPKGCSAVFGPQKGLRPEDLPLAEKCLRQLASILNRRHGIDCAKVRGAGAAGGLGFGLMAFTGAQIQSGFELFAQRAELDKKIAAADLVITAEGAIDAQTFMGKGVGQIARRCKKLKVPCFALAGVVSAPGRMQSSFKRMRALTEIASLDNAMRQPTRLLKKLASQLAKDF